MVAFFADVNVAIRKIALMLKPAKDIVHDGDHMIIKTLTTFKNYNMDFSLGKEFEEDLSGVDGRKCMVSGFVCSAVRLCFRSGGLWRATTWVQKICGLI